MMAKNKRMLAVLLAVTLVAVMLLSTAFLVEEAHHDCVGDGCQICLQMNICRPHSGGRPVAVQAAAAY